MESPQPIENPFKEVAETTPPVAGTPPVQEIEFANIDLINLKNPLRDDPNITQQIELADELALLARVPLIRAIQEGKIVTASIMIVVDENYQETFPISVPPSPDEKSIAILQGHVNRSAVGILFSIQEFQRCAEYWKRQIAGALGFKQVKGLTIE